MNRNITALDVAKEWAALAGKTIIYTAATGGFLIVILYLASGIDQTIRIMK